MRKRMTILVPAVAAVAAVLAAAGCATVHDPGWRGEGATPFDTAEAQCRAEAPAREADARATAFTDCMARHGWHRGGG